MNCQEVMEYMQRQLDGDLDEQETEILMTHTRHCPNCAAMFERLQLLSSGLENLPKVTPSYSLVDAIMPRLQELQTTVDASESVSSAGKVEQAPADTRREPRNRTAVRWRDRFSLRALGGVIAAGVIVGLFLVNYQSGNPLHTANDSASTGSMTAESAATSDSAAADSNTSSDAAANAPKADREVQTSNAPNEGVDKMLNKSYGADDDVHDQAAAAESVDPNGERMMKHDYKQSAEPPDDKAASPNYEVSGTTVTENKSDAGASAADSGNQTKLGSDSKGIASTNDDQTFMAKDSVSGFTVNELQAASQDGKYKAFVVDQTLQVYSAEDDVKLFESASRPAGITSLLWSPDSKTLTYETPAADGKSKLRYIVDIASASEQLQEQ
ncbi:zf-HC2 domain-containing protein [Paenibacillus solisilvae]|uniref:Anti-sigma-W factor RsiW n=1 Tax=Paenibacillus solisilvae TaxID=2486751 RepID=A0ABW0W1M3_9BACL